VSTSSQSLQKYAKPVFSAAGQKDNIAPYSYQDWFKSYQGIIPSQEFKQYNEYLVNWYKDRSKLTVDSKLQLKLNYLTLLKQLQVFFTNEESENWYNQVNVENENELLLAIPYFAKKLKDISLYYLQLRSSVKEARLRYNQVGTDPAIINEIQKLLLTNYTQKADTSITIPYSTWKSVPQLSSIKDSLTIEIEELYDKQNYFDQSLTIPVSAYYDLTNDDLQEFLTSKNLALTSTDWLYRLGTYSLSGDYIDTVWNGVLNNDTATADIVNRLAEKYIGQNKFTSFTPSYSTVQDFYSIDIEDGNNFFLWPGILQRTQAKALPRYSSIHLQDTEITSLGTGGSSLDIADTIFVKSTRGLEGAWLYKKDNEITNVVMESIIDSKNKTAFRFPFPGFGLSAEDINWTGPGLLTDPRFFYLDDTYKQNVERAYWTTNLEASSVRPLLINNTSLVQNKAYPNKQYQFADKINVRETAPVYDQVSYTGDSKESWLYRFDNTSISIPAAGYSLIYWPYEKIQNPNDPIPTYFPDSTTDVCVTTHISSVNFYYAAAGKTINDADIIYRINNYTDTIEKATECCWLSGKETGSSLYNTIATKQPSFQGVFRAGEYTQFIWLGQNNTNANSVFQSLNHDPDCKFVTTKETTYKDFSLCTCRQIQFTPFGHPGTNYTDNKSFADAIFEGNLQENINISNRPLSSFCWFKTNAKQGWGNGEWVTNQNQNNNVFLNNDFYLQTGKTYVYYRANTDLNETFPELVVRYNFNTYNTKNYGKDFIWVSAVKDNDGNWSSTDRPSNMSLNPGDFLVYNRASTNTHTLTSTIIEQKYIAENKGSIWSNYDYITHVKDPIDTSLSANFIQKNVFVNYPQQTYFTKNNTTSESFIRQLPLNANRVVNILQWTVSHYENNSITNPTVTTTITGEPTLSFIPTLTGIYTVTVRAITAATNPPQVVTPATLALGTAYYSNTGIYTFTNIPHITAIPVTTNTPSQTAYSTPLPGYVLSTPLKGWDYNLNSFSPIIITQNNGAKPYWAKTYTDKVKGIDAWGTPKRIVDNHNIITQPEFSDIILQTGTYIEYTRNYNTDLKWKQPLVLAVSSSEQVWNKLEFNINSNVVPDFNNLVNITNDNLIVIPTTSASDIVLRNFVDNEPVEVLYNASQSFTWNITATPEIRTTYAQPLSETLTIQGVAPWSNLSNQHFPTVAAIPSFNKLYSQKDAGGFFTPSDLGVTTYLNKDYTTQLNITSQNLTTYFDDVNKTYNTRGLSLQDQPNPYTLLDENNIWLKEHTIAGPIAGSIKKNIFKKYQKFLPYQSKFESNSKYSVGLITPTSRHTPWGGKDDLEWTDYNNFPVSPTGEINVGRWTGSQILKKKTQQIDTWVSDVFGNQYGLYKEKFLENNYLNRKEIPGELWVRTNKQIVSPASKALTGLFDTYLNTPHYPILTGNGINKIDVFFDTLMIETTGYIIFEKINYDYNTDNIFSLVDDARYISLAVPTRSDFSRELAGITYDINRVGKIGETWFFPSSKKVIISVCSIMPHTSSLSPAFYWELYNPGNTQFLNLTGSATLPLESESYIVTVSGLQIPSNTYRIDPQNRKIEFLQPILSGTDVYILLPYNPDLTEKYDLPPKQITTVFSIPKNRFKTPDLSNFSTPYSYNNSQFLIAKNGIIQQPKTLSGDNYTILDDYLVNFNTTVSSNEPITVTRLPNYTESNNFTFYTWCLKTIENNTTILNLSSGPENISFCKESYIVNINGTILPPSKYQVNSDGRTIRLLTPIPANVSISITLLSTPPCVYLLPELYELDLNTQNLQKVFPSFEEDVSSLKQNDFELVNINSPTLSFNTLTNEFLFSVFGKNNNGQNVLVDYSITNYLTYNLKDIIYYKPNAESQVEEPPILQTPLIVKLRVTPFYREVLDFQCVVTNGEGIFKASNLPSWINLTESGRFYGVPPVMGIDDNPEEYDAINNENHNLTAIYKIEFSVENSFGPVFGVMVIEVELITSGRIFEDNYLILENSNEYLLDNDGNKIFLDTTEIPLTYTPTEPYININNQLVTFESQQILPSTPQVFSINGNNLFAPITAYAPQYFEISFNDVDYTNRLILPLFSGTKQIDDTPIYIRIVQDAPLGTEITQLTAITLKEQPIPFTSSVYLSSVVDVARLVVPPAPSIRTEYKFFPFTATAINELPSTQSLIVEGFNLQGPIEVSGLGDFDVSLDNITYSESVFLYPISSYVTKTRVYVRLKQFLLNGFTNKNIKLSSFNALDVIIPVSVIVDYPSFQPYIASSLKLFTTQAGINSQTQFFTLSSRNVFNNFIITAPPKYEITLPTSTYISRLSPSLTNIPFTIPVIITPVSYVSFNNINYPSIFYVYEGKNVVFFVASNYFSTPSVLANMQTLISVFDKAYEWYAFYTGRIPFPYAPNLYNNKLVIVGGVNSTCGELFESNGCGLISYTGVEIIKPYWDTTYVNNLTSSSNTAYDQILFYELGRNFWFYDSQLIGSNYNSPDGLGCIDTAYAIFMSLLTIEKTNVQGAPIWPTSMTFNEYKNYIESLLSIYINGEYNFYNTFKDDTGVPNPLNFDCSYLLASLFLNLKNRFGDIWLENIWKKIQQKSLANTKQEAVDNFIISCAEAVQLNVISLFEDYYKWPISPQAKAYIEQFPPYQELTFTQTLSFTPVNNIITPKDILVRLTSQATPPSSYNGNINISDFNIISVNIPITGITT